MAVAPRVIQNWRTQTPNNPPASGSLLPGQLAVEMAVPTRLWVGVPTTLDATGQKLLYDSSAVGGGAAYVLKAGDTMTGALNSPGLHALSDNGAWQRSELSVGGSASNRWFFGTGAGGEIFLTAKFAGVDKTIFFSDGVTRTQINGGLYTNSLDVVSSIAAGGNITTALEVHALGVLLASDPILPMYAVTKQYCDANASGGAPGTYVLKAGDTMTGHLVVPSINASGTITANYLYAAAGGAILGAGLEYAFAPGHWHAFGWDAAAGVINAYVDGSWVGTLATYANLAAYLPLAGGTISGKLTSVASGGSVAGNIAAIEIQDGGEALIAFHRPGAMAMMIGLDALNRFAIGGWSWTPGRVIIDSTGALTSAAGIYAASVVSGDHLMTVTGITYYANNYAYYSGRSSVDGAHRWVENGAITLTLDGVGNLTAPGQLAGSQLVLSGTLGVLYPWSGYWVAFGWNGLLNVYINGGYIGDMATTTYVHSQGFATQGWAGGAFLWKSGDTCTGSLNINQQLYAMWTGGYWSFNLTNTGALTMNHGTCAKTGGGPWTATSDVRIKIDVADYTAGLTAICGLRTVSYKLNPDLIPWATDETLYGLVAQEAVEVMPEIIFEDTITEELDMLREESPVLAMNANAVTWALVNAVKELSAMNSALAARVAALEAV